MKFRHKRYGIKIDAEILPSGDVAVQTKTETIVIDAQKFAQLYSEIKA